MKKRIAYKDGYYLVQVRRRIFFFFHYWDTIDWHYNLEEAEKLYNIAHRIKWVNK